MKTLSVRVLNGHADYIKKSEINLSKYLQVRLDRDMYDDMRRRYQRELIRELREKANDLVVTHSDIGCVKINNVLLKNRVGDVDNNIYILYVRENDDIIPDVARLFEEVAIFTAEELNIYKHDTKDAIARTIRAKRHELYRDSKGNFYVLSIIK